MRKRKGRQKHGGNLKRLKAEPTGDWRKGKWKYSVCFPGTGNVIAHGGTKRRAVEKAWQELYKLFLNRHKACET